MRTKLLLTTVFVTAAACSCSSNNKSPEEYVNSDALIVYESTEIPEANKTPLTVVTAAPEQKRMTYAFNGTNVEIMLGDEEIGEIATGYPADNPPQSSDIILGDFNFDGCGDIFIYNEGHEGEAGTYYCFDSKDRQFVSNEQLNNIGKLLSHGEDDTLIDNYEADGRKIALYYQWDKGELKTVKRTETYTDITDNMEHTDTYEFDKNGEAVLVTGQ